jgi:hypothetical protein
MTIDIIIHPSGGDMGKVGIAGTFSHRLKRLSVDRERVIKADIPRIIN